MSKDLENYLKSFPFDESICHVVGPHIAGNPVLFFILYSASEQQGIDSEKERISSEIIQQLAREADVREIFVEGINLELSQVLSSVRSEADKLLAEGVINGAHHAQIVSSIPLTLVCIDEMEGYKNSTDLLRKWKSKRVRMIKALSILYTALKRITVHANKTVQLLLKRREAYNSDLITLSGYVCGLARQAESVGLSFERTPEFLDFYKLALSEQELNLEKAKKEIEIFADELVQTLGDKEFWLQRIVGTFCPPQTEELYHPQELKAQVRFLSRYLANSSNIQKLRESPFLRMAMYGAYAEGFTGLEDPNVSQEKREKAFLSGILQGPTHILKLLMKKLIAGLHEEMIVPEAYDFMLDVVAFAGFDETRIPNLVRYVQYGNRYRTRPTFQLMKEIERIERKLLERLIVSEHDKEIVDLYTAHTALRRRVQLQVEWGQVSRQYIQEQLHENCALKIKHAFLMQKVMRKEVHAALEVLNEVESISRKFYQRLEERSQTMAANLQAELWEKEIDRAIVYVGEYHCKSLIASLDQDTSYALLMPLSGTDNSDSDFFDGMMSQEGMFGAESNIVFYRDIEEDFENAPRKLCDNPLCRFSAPVIYDRIICFTHPGSRAVFYCATCSKYCCGLELKPVFMSDEDFEILLPFNSTELKAMNEGNPPFSLQCRHCGSLVGKSERTIIWNVSSNRSKILHDFSESINTLVLYN